MSRGGAEERRGSPSGELARALFEEALRLPPEERAVFLERRTLGHPALGAEVDGLLASEAALGSFLAHPWAPARPRLLADGARLGEHEIEAYLGGGGGGQVYRARELAAQRSVALKVAALDGLAPPDRERFLRGTHIAATIRHPSLVEVYASGVDSAHGLVFCSMRLVGGVSLQELLAELVERGEPPVGAVRRAIVARLAEVASAVGALHAQGIVHRDVKPANVMLEGSTPESPWSGRAVLVDFGLVRSLHGDSRTSILGTLPYLAPEVLLESRADARADVYALGLCLYDLLSARFPGARGGFAGRLAPLSSRVPDVDPELAAIVRRALEPDPEHRHEDGGELALELERWLAEESGLVRVLRRIRRLPTRVLRGSLGTWTATLVALAGIAGMQTTSALRGRAREVRAAFESGDLLAFERAAARVPEPLQGLLLEASMLSPLASLKAHDSPEADVVRTGTTRDHAAALLQAARYLGRDGLEAQPNLTRFLGQALDSPRDLHDALNLCARLFFERPCVSAAELAAAGPIRQRLLEILAQAPVSDDDRLFAITALGGSGTPATCTGLVAWLASRSAESPWILEEIRLVTRALELIARRSESAGYRRELAGLDWNVLLASIQAALAEEAATGRPNPDYGVARALDGLACVVARIRAREGLAPLTVDLGQNLEYPIVFRAANRDAALVADPRAVFAHLEKPATHGPYLAAGRALGVLGQPHDLGWIRAALAEQGLDSEDETGLGFIDEGWESGSSGYDGLPDQLLPDRETRLGSWFAQADAPWMSLRNESSMTRTDVAPDAIASWTFLSDGLHLLGEALEVESRAVAFKPDEPGSASTFACLGVGGLSELRILFREPSERALVLRLLVQKGVRSWLPFEGEASTIVTFDGVERTLPVTDDACREATLILAPRLGAPDGLRSLSIRLADSSTTTFRIYRLEIALQED